MVTTAEGVEIAEQLERVRAEGCTEVQGFPFSAARPAAEIADLIRTLASRAQVAAKPRQSHRCCVIAHELQAHLTQ